MRDGIRTSDILPKGDIDTRGTADSECLGGSKIHWYEA